MGAILAQLLGGTFVKVLGDGIVSPVLSYLGQRSNADLQKFTTAVGAERDAQVALIQANMAAYHEQTQLAALRFGWWGTRWLLIAAALPPIVHSGAVYLDSTFKFGWAIARAPGVYEGQEINIIAAVVGYQVAQTAVGGFMTWLNKR
jgi:hypothetical protein